MLDERVVLVSYSEIALKSPPVRRKLETLLAHHIRIALKKSGVGDARVGRIRGRLIIENVDPLKASETVSKTVFGVCHTMPALRVSSELPRICEASTQVASETIQPNQTFAVRARRITGEGYTSRDIEVSAGAMILEQLKGKDVRVNLDNPDITINIEARGDSAYVYSRVFQGVLGLPFGSQGKLVSLISGGIDSPVATWLMMKRGAYPILLFMDQRPSVGSDYFEKAANVARRLRQYVPLDDYPLYSAPMGEIMREIVDKIPSKFTCVVCKRMMYRIACGFATRKKADGIVTGENLGQVASQTLANLLVLDEVSPLPVYRPLISFEKDEIVELARKIGTFELSTGKAHGCTAVPSKPSTRARIQDVKGMEEYLDVDNLVSQALERIDQVPL